METTERESGEWTMVVPRRRRHRDRKAEDNMDKKVSSTTIYFTNFPDEVHLQELIYRFSKFGDIEDIYIPEKRNKSGKHFGFVRFRGAEDMKLIEAKMKELWFGTYKLWANIARFEKNDERGRTQNRENREERKIIMKEGGIVKASKTNQENRKVESMSYAEAAGGKAARMTEQDNQFRQREKQKEWTGISYESVEEDRSWAKKGLVGIVNHPQEVQMLQQKILDVGISTIRIIPMGGRKVFIQPTEDEDLWAE
jgi:RNA recognition motif-containing protein